VLKSTPGGRPSYEPKRFCEDAPLALQTALADPGRGRGGFSIDPKKLMEPSNTLSDRRGSLEVKHANPTDAADWDNFVNQHPEGRYCHLWGYRAALERAYGYRCVYLRFLIDGSLCGVFPSICHPRHKKWLISQPFNEYGGPLTRELSPAQYGELSSLLLETIKEQGRSAIEVRGGIGCEQAALAGHWTRQVLHSYALLNLEDPEKLWRKALTNEARKGVNKARKSGLTTEIRRGTGAIENPFYDLYLDSMKRLGVPPHSKRFFEELAAGIGDRLLAAWVMGSSGPAAILLGAATGRRVHIFVIASDPGAWSMRPSDLAHWELIAWACQQGMQVFDFGSARYAGQIQFKKKWGVSLYDYGFYVISTPGSQSPAKIQTVNTSSRTMTTMATIWRRFMPLPLTRVFGPPIRKYLTK
jgi:Acetyltransferase (GNAT) domain